MHIYLLTQNAFQHLQNQIAVKSLTYIQAFLKTIHLQLSSTYELQIHSIDYNTLQLVNTQEKENLKPLYY